MFLNCKDWCQVVNDPQPWTPATEEDTVGCFALQDRCQAMSKELVGKKKGEPGFYVWGENVKSTDSTGASCMSQRLLIDYAYNQAGMVEAGQHGLMNWVSYLCMEGTCNFLQIQRGTETQSNKASCCLWASSNKHAYQTTITPPSFVLTWPYLDSKRIRKQLVKGSTAGQQMITHSNMYHGAHHQTT